MLICLVKNNSYSPRLIIAIMIENVFETMNQEKNPLISIIIPTYNRAHTLARSIQSVLNQTYKNFELIIVDDGSKDNTENVVQSINDNRIICIKNLKNCGQSIAKNIGIRRAKSNYIAFHDSDDEWLPEKLQAQIDVFKKLPNCSVVYTDMWRITENGHGVYFASPDITLGRIVNPKTMNYQTRFIGGATVLIKRMCFNNVGVFNKNLKKFEDLELLIRMALKYDFYHIKKPLIKYYYSQDGVTADSSKNLLAWEMLFNLYEKELIKENREFVGMQCINLGKGYQKINLIKSLVYYLKALFFSPKNILGHILKKVTRHFSLGNTKIS